VEETSARVKDVAVEEQLRKCADDIILKQTAINGVKERIEEYKYELKEIQEAAIRFGLYLKKNSIAPYNDAMLMYFDHLIKEEFEKVRLSQASRKSMDALERSRREYEQRIYQGLYREKGGKLG
jgi:hypothetical protein